MGRSSELYQQELEREEYAREAAVDLLDVLREAARQIEYLHEKFQPTGSGEQVLALIAVTIAKAEGRR